MKPTAVIGVPSTSDSSAYQENRDLVEIEKLKDELAELNRKVAEIRNKILKELEGA